MKYLNDIQPGDHTLIVDRFDIDPTIPLDDQLDTTFDQDLFFIDYDQRFGIDVGWYSAEPKNRFGIHLIENGNWEEPLLESYTRDIFGVKSIVSTCIEIINSKLSTE